jgi:hypothetical protein
VHMVEAHMEEVHLDAHLLLALHNPFYLNTH